MAASTVIFASSRYAISMLRVPRVWVAKAQAGPAGGLPHEPVGRLNAIFPELDIDGKFPPATGDDPLPAHARSPAGTSGIAGPAPMPCVPRHHRSISANTPQPRYSRV